MKNVKVVQYDPQWPAAYLLASGEVAAVFGRNLIEIHHIGSTAIPGIFAKPVIDMLPVVADIALLDEVSAKMESLGYEVMGEFGIEGRRYFRRDNTAGDRTHQIHAFQFDSPNVARHLAFRDFMQAHRELASEYSALKQRLAAAHPNDINAYMGGKDPFIKEMEFRALAWVDKRDRK